jgi:polar amino acid transport system permease protein
MLSDYFVRLMAALPVFIKGLWVTIQVSGVSLIGSTVLGFCVGIVSSCRIPILRRLLACYVDLVRGTPFLVQIFIVFFILPEFGIQFDAFTASVISLTFYGTAYISEIVSASIVSIPPGQTEAAISSGLNWRQRMRLVILPQALRPTLPPLVGQYVLLIKDSSVVSVIGLTDVARAGWLTVQRIPEGLMVFGLVGILYFAICYPLIHLANWFEKRLAGETIHL